MNMVTAIRIVRKFVHRKWFSDDPQRDIYLVSYPRSGNTWMRAVIAELLLKRKTTSLRELDYIVPDIYYRIPKNKIPNLDKYIVKSHEPFRTNLPSAKYRKVIYLVRDPRNVAVSYYRYIMKNELNNYPTDEFISNFVSGKIFPCSWQEHVSSWTVGMARAIDLLIIKYEDLIQSPKENIKRIAEFIGINPKDNLLDEVIASCPKEGMREKEFNGNRPEIESKELYFIGSGNGELILTAQQEQLICDYARIPMEIFGYR